MKDFAGKALAIGAGLAAGAVLAALFTYGILADAPPPAPTPTSQSVNEDVTLPPCATEDSTGCYWDAEAMGNGLGHDVVTPTVTELPVPVQTAVPPAPVEPITPRVIEPVKPVEPVQVAPVEPAPPAPPVVVEPPAVNEDEPLTADDFPDPDGMPICGVEDDPDCFYPGIERGDACDWINWHGIAATLFLNCVDPAQNGVVQ